LQLTNAFDQNALYRQETLNPDSSKPSAHFIRWLTETIMSGRSSEPNDDAVWEGYTQRVCKFHERNQKSFSFGTVEHAMALTCHTNARPGSAPILPEIIRTPQSSSQTNRLLLVGDYGTGKTILCGQLAYQLAQIFRENPKTGKIPIVIRLRHVTNLSAFSSIAYNSIRDLYNRSIDEKIIARASEAGRLAFILDGFDEFIEMNSVQDAAVQLREVLANGVFYDNAVIISNA